MAQAGSRIKSWGASVTSSVGSIAAGAGLGIAGMFTAGIAASVAFYKASSATIKKLAEEGRSADALGVRSDFFMGLTQNAKLFHVEGEAVTAMLVKLGAHISEAKGGNDKFAKTLKGLGVDLKDLKGKGLEEQFYSLVGAMEKIPDAGKKSAAAMEIFGKQGVALFPLLAQGSDKIKDYIEKMKSLGVAISAEDMFAVQRAKAALPKLGLALEGFWNRIVVASAPLIELIAVKLSAAVASLQPLFAGLSEAAKVGFLIEAELLKMLFGAVGGLGGKFQELLVTWKVIGQDFPGVGNTIIEVLRYISNGFVNVLDQLGLWTNAWDNALKRMVDGSITVLDAFRKMDRNLANLGIFPNYHNSLAEEHENSIHQLMNLSDKLGSKLKTALNQKLKIENAVGAFAGIVALAEIRRSGVDRFFDDIKAKFNAPPAPIVNPPRVPDIKPPDYKPSPALLKDTKDAYSVETKFMFDSLQLKGVQERHLTEAQKQTNILQGLKDICNLILIAVNKSGLEVGIL